MKLLICAAGELFGGVERHILDLCSFRLRRGAGAPVVLLFHDAVLAEGIRRMGIEPLIMDGNCRYDPRLVARVRRLYRDEAIDVVHVHGYRAMITCGLARTGCVPRLVKTEHGLPELAAGSRLARAKARVNAFLDQSVTRRRCDAVCYVTRDIASRYADRHAGIARFHVPNGIDAVEVSRLARPAEFEHGSVHVGVVGRVSAVKAIDVAIRAFARLEADPPARLWIIGSGPERERLEALVRDLGLTSRVGFLGFKRDVYSYLAHLDIVLMPSWHEGLPYSLLEGMSLGRAFLASRVGGLAEVLRDTQTALLVPAGDEAALASALARLVGDEPLRRRLGAAARDEQGRAYTLEAMASAYEAIYADGTGPGCAASRLAK